MNSACLFSKPYLSIKLKLFYLKQVSLKYPSLIHILSLPLTHINHNYYYIIIFILSYKELTACKLGLQSDPLDFIKLATSFICFSTCLSDILSAFVRTHIKGLFVSVSISINILSESYNPTSISISRITLCKLY